MGGCLVCGEAVAIGASLPLAFVIHSSPVTAASTRWQRAPCGVTAAQDTRPDREDYHPGGVALSVSPRTPAGPEWTWWIPALRIAAGQPGIDVSLYRDKRIIKLRTAG